MYAFSVIRLFFLTDLLLWLGKGQGANHKGMREKDGRKAELLSVMTTSKRRNK